MATQLTFSNFLPAGRQRWLVSLRWVLISLAIIAIAFVLYPAIART